MLPRMLPASYVVTFEAPHVIVEGICVGAGAAQRAAVRRTVQIFLGVMRPGPRASRATGTGRTVEVGVTIVS